MSIESSGSCFRKTDIYINKSLTILARYTKLLPYGQIHVIKFTYNFLHMQIKHLIFKLNLIYLNSGDGCEFCFFTSVLPFIFCV